MTTHEILQRMLSKLFESSNKIGCVLISLALLLSLFGPFIVALYAPVERYENFMDALEKAQMLLFGTGLMSFMAPNKWEDRKPKGDE
jgi:hypothetical protein